MLSINQQLLQVKWSILGKYVKAGGIWILSLLLSFHLLAILMQVGLCTNTRSVFNVIAVNIVIIVVAVITRVSQSVITNFTCSCSLLLTITKVGTNIWLSKWSDDPVEEDLDEAQEQTNIRLGVYAAFGAGQSKAH